MKRLSQRVDVLTSEKAVLTEQQAQLLGEAESQTMPTNLERESARTTMPTNLERESARTTLVQKASPRRRSSTATTFAWGRNTHGQLGVEGGGEAAVSSIDNLPTAKAIACSHFHTLALDMSGNVYSWGRGALGWDVGGDEGGGEGSGVPGDGGGGGDGSGEGGGGEEGRL